MVTLLGSDRLTNRKAKVVRVTLEKSSEPAAARCVVDSRKRPPAGLLIINADDWGRDCETTVRTLECVRFGTISSVSGMVFMEGSERAAALARQKGIDVGLHLNFTTPFSGPGIPTRLSEHQHRLSRYLLKRRLNQGVYHPALAASFEYVVKVQCEEFSRLYGEEATRIDGHHHMHLCANVLFGGLLPAGTIVRRNCSFASGEKRLANRLYRKIMDRVLARRHPVVDLFFSLCPLDQSRLDRIFGFAGHSVVELETHPTNSEEYRFLTGAEVWRRLGELRIAPRYAVSRVGSNIVPERRPE
jgi:predicted glycoside hydrolase/deacetylase ChbG (UPF0249 family)